MKQLFSEMNEAKKSIYGFFGIEDWVLEPEPKLDEKSTWYVTHGLRGKLLIKDKFSTKTFTATCVKKTFTHTMVNYVDYTDNARVVVLSNKNKCEDLIDEI